MLVSEVGHYSLSKAVDVLGLGTDNVISIPTKALKLDVEALEAKLDELAAAKRPVIAIVAVAGTTEAGTFDPIRPMAKLAKKHGAWLHVDAAWAGGLIFSPKARPHFDGIELCDSITIDAHKNLFSPMGFGMVLYREARATAAIMKTAQYIIRKTSPDLGKYCLEGSRPAQVLHLHAALHALGRDGLAAVMDRKIAVTSGFAQLIDAAPDFELCQQPECDILLFRALPPGGTKATDEEGREEELNAYNIALHELQKLHARTFVSRTMVCDPRKAKRADGAKTVFLRVVVNAQVGLDNCRQALADLRLIGTALQLDPAPLAECRTLLQALADSAIKAPNAVAVRTSDPKPSAAGGGSAAGAIPASESGGGAGGVGSLTYGALLTEALHVANHLLTDVSAKGHVVPILCDRNVDAYVAIVACLLRGCAWLMIDSSLPPQRIAHLLSEATPCEEALVADTRRGAFEAALAHLSAKGKTDGASAAPTPRHLTPFLAELRGAAEGRAPAGAAPPARRPRAGRRGARRAVARDAGGGRQGGRVHDLHLGFHRPPQGGQDRAPPAVRPPARLRGAVGRRHGGGQGRGDRADRVGVGHARARHVAPPDAGRDRPPPPRRGAARRRARRLGDRPRRRGGRRARRARPVDPGHADLLPHPPRRRLARRRLRRPDVHRERRADAARPRARPPPALRQARQLLRPDGGHHLPVL